MKSLIYILVLLCVNFLFSQSNQAPVLTATGNEAYCPLSKQPIVSNFTISDIDDTTVEAFYIQISEGYQQNSDMLLLIGNHPTIVSSWNSSEGKLTLTGVGGSNILLLDLENAVRDIVFESSLVDNINDKTFSLTVGDANFLPATGHYYEFIASDGINWLDARDQAQNRFYYGLQGYLATITSQEEAKIIGEQAQGTGWIGGTDRDQEGVWRWVTGPEAGTIFWNGNQNGGSPNFAFWNTGEPNNTNGNEHYAHVTDPSIGISGSWNDLTVNGEASGPYRAKGYMVEYGGLSNDPVLNIAVSTKLYIPKITSITTDEICENSQATLSATSSEGTILWFEDSTGGNAIASGATFNTPMLTGSRNYYVATSVNGCLTSPRTAVFVTVNLAPSITSVEDAKICGSGAVSVSATASEGDVVWYESSTSTVPIFTGENYEFRVTSSMILYVEAQSNGCVSSSRSQVNITVGNTIPEFQVPSTITLCNDESKVAEAISTTTETYSYLWKDANGKTISETENAEFTQSGDYFVYAISSDGCISEEKKIVVLDSAVANVSDVASFSIDDTTTNNKITINSDVLGNGNYEFSIDDENGTYTNQNIIENITVGTHVLYIRDVNGCGTAQFTFSVLNYPNFFTPNQDGINDVWTLEGFDKNFYPVSQITIFNRFGKMIKKFTANDFSWDGTYKGNLLPPTDYWFKITLTDVNGRITNKMGNFSLLSR